MIKLVKPEKVYKSDLGDLLCELCELEPGDCQALQYLSANQDLPNKIIPLALVNPNPWVALQGLKIEYESLVVKYECPYTLYAHCAILPISILLIEANLASYPDLGYPAPDYLFDWEWHQQMWREQRHKVNDIQKILLGSGYTHSTMIHDGSPRIHYTSVPLDNGDALWVAFWKWYNK